jgi:hypothetical protein
MDSNKKNKTIQNSIPVKPEKNKNKIKNKKTYWPTTKQKIILSCLRVLFLFLSFSPKENCSCHFGWSLKTPNLAGSQAPTKQMFFPLLRWIE